MAMRRKIACGRDLQFNYYSYLPLSRVRYLDEEDCPAEQESLSRCQVLLFLLPLFLCRAVPHGNGTSRIIMRHLRQISSISSRLTSNSRKELAP